MTESRGYTCVIREIGYGRLLTEEEKNKLIDILSYDEPVYKIAAYLLLDRKEKARELLNSISEEEQKGIMDYPISVFMS